MPTITISGALYEDYANAAEAKTYAQANSQGASWLLADGALQKQLLVTATSVFERTLWNGSPTLPIDKTQPQTVGTQPLAWGRTGLSDREGVPLDPDSIPADVAAGNINYAFNLLADLTIQNADARGSNLKTDKVLKRVEGAITKSTEQSFFRGTLGALAPFEKIVMDYIGEWLSSTAALAGPHVTGLDTISPIDGAAGDYSYTGDGLP